MTAFHPTRPDGRSRAQVIFDMAVTSAPGTLLTYDDMAAELELEDLDKIRRAAYTAGRKLRRHAHRSLEAVPVRDTGCSAARARPPAGGYQGKARRQVRRSLDVVRATDVGQLNASERSLHDAMNVLAVALVGALRHVDARLGEHSQAIGRLEDQAAAAKLRLEIISKRH